MAPAETPDKGTYRKPRPNISRWTKPYWEATSRHELRLQKCVACGHVRYPIAELCPKCWSKESTWELLSGRARLHSWVRFHKQYLPGFEPDLPYPVALVELEEGPRLITHIVGMDPSEYRLGMEVVVTFDDVAPDLTLPKFRPASNS